MTRAKLLIANRGEIAVRIAHTVRALGLSPVAVFSQADRNALHVQVCDEAYCIGPAPAAQSYLRGSAIVEAAQRCGACMVHPGYGFLSENATFARQVRAAGLAFVGPPEHAMQVMGNKTRARAAMQKAGVPVVPGIDVALPAGDAGAKRALQLAGEMGLPVMLKASSGGGGKGMRLVTLASALPQALAAASSEAYSAFGDGAVYLEKAIVAPRHVEVQIFSDAQGNTLFIGERECSLQRRHQKVIEETPAPCCDATLRARMGEVACAAARAVDYRGAGTVEFLLDGDGNFFFLEMNTRLQVEHAVTEMCYGVDLVAAQIAVTQGAPLGLRQQDLTPRGHAIEARLCAEDARQNFLPSPGRVGRVCWPTGSGIRVDAGVHPGYEVPRHYDPMIAKIIAWAPTRAAAARRLVGALEQTVVAGITHNGHFLSRVLQHETFATGQYHTASLATMLDDPAFLTPPPVAARRDVQLAAAAIARLHNDLRRPRGDTGHSDSRWQQTPWRQWRAG